MASSGVGVEVPGMHPTTISGGTETMFTTPHVSRAERTSARRVRRTLAVVAGAVSAATLALSAPALAGVGTFGPIDPDHGFPTWYDDGNGGKLALCLDGPPLCLAGVPNP